MCEEPPASGPAVFKAAPVSAGPAVLGSDPVTVLPMPPVSAARVAKGGSSLLWLPKWEP